MTNVEEKKLKYITPPTRGSFVHLVKPTSIDGTNPKYSMTIGFDKGSEPLKILRELVNEACLQRYGKTMETLSTGKLGKFTLPFKDGDAPECKYPNFKGQYYFKIQTNATSKDGRDIPPPVVINRQKKRLTTEDELYSGAYYQIEVYVAAWKEGNYGKGVSFHIGNVLFVKDGEKFTSREDAEDTFAAFLVEEEEVEAVVNAEDMLKGL